MTRQGGNKRDNQLQEYLASKAKDSGRVSPVRGKPPARPPRPEWENGSKAGDTPTG